MTGSYFVGRLRGRYGLNVLVAEGEHQDNLHCALYPAVAHSRHGRASQGRRATFRFNLNWLLTRSFPSRPPWDSSPHPAALKVVPTCAASAGSVLATCYSERTMLARGLVDQGGIAVPGVNLWPSTKLGDPESGRCHTDPRKLDLGAA